jgi:hypothetical protein
VEHILTTPTPSFPFIPLTIEPPKQLDVASRTVLRYFEAGREDDKREQADAFDHMVAICYRAVQPYFLRDRHGSLTVIGIPQFGGIDGHRTGHTLRKEGAALDATREWIQAWLLRFLAPYRTLSKAELTAAADSGTFRYIARLCRLRLKGIVCRKLEREKKDGFAGFVSLDAPFKDGEDASRADNLLGTNRQAPISSLARHVSYDEVMLSVENARRIVDANVDQLGRLDLLTGLLAVLMVAGHVEEPYFEGLVTRTIAGMRGISETAARAYKRRYSKTMARELEARNPVLQSMFKELEQESPRPVVVSSGSHDYGERKRLLHEARQLTTEFANDCRAQGLTRSAELAARGERKLLSEEDGLRERLSSTPERDLERFLDDYQPMPGSLPS